MIIDNKIAENAIETMKPLFSSLREDVAIYSTSTPNLTASLSEVVELRMDLKMSAVLLISSMQTCLYAQDAYSKRFYIKNLAAGMNEIHKLVFGFNKMKKHTIWTKIKNTVNPYEHPELSSIYDEITNSSLELEKIAPPKDERNLTYHYDKDLIKVYAYTLQMDSEEDVMSIAEKYLSIIHRGLILCNMIEAIENENGNKIIEPAMKLGHINLPIHKTMAAALSKNEKIHLVNRMALQSVPEIDKSARFLSKYNNLVEELTDKYGLVIHDELCELLELENIELLLKFMMTDIATVMAGYYGAKSQEEIDYAINIRLIKIILTSTITHLWGYSDNEKQISLWSKIKAIIDRHHIEVHEDVNNIEQLFQKVEKDNNKNTRNTYVHLIDNSSYKSLVPSLVDALQDLNPVKILEDAKYVLYIVKSLRQLNNKIIIKIQEKIDKDTQEREKQLSILFDKLKNIIELSEIADTEKSNLFSNLEQLKSIILSQK